jgi:hypothetical protein
LIAIEPGEEGDSGGVALRGVVELREAQALFGESIEVGRFDFTAVAPKVLLSVGNASIIASNETVSD